MQKNIPPGADFSLKYFRSDSRRGVTRFLRNIFFTELMTSQVSTRLLDTKKPSKQTKITSDVKVVQSFKKGKKSVWRSSWRYHQIFSNQRINQAWARSPNKSTILTKKKQVGSDQDRFEEHFYLILKNGDRGNCCQLLKLKIKILLNVIEFLGWVKMRKISIFPDF